MRSRLLWITAPLLTVSLAACGGSGTGGGDGTGLAGTVNGDGSSTVFPIMEAAAEEFQLENPDAQVNVGVSGTGGGFERFCAGELDFVNASRDIQEEEAAACESNGIDPVRLRTGSDGLSVVTNKELEVDCLTTEQLRKLFSDPSVETWSQLDPELPDVPVSLFQPGADSGTYDFFLEEVIGDPENGAAFRSDDVVQTSEDDNVLVTGVKGTPGGVGFFGLSYYQENEADLNLVAIDGGEGCVEPSAETVQDGTYTPLSRPLYTFVDRAALEENPVLRPFLSYVLSEDGQALVEEVGYVALDEATLAEQLALLEG